MNSEGRSVQNPLATLDLSRFRIDSESFVGQVIELGARFEKLPPNIGDALLGFFALAGVALWQALPVGYCNQAWGFGTRGAAGTDFYGSRFGGASGKRFEPGCGNYRRRRF